MVINNITYRTVYEQPQLTKKDNEMYLDVLRETYCPLCQGNHEGTWCQANDGYYGYEGDVA